MKVLILKPSSLGDVVQALPVLRLLKQHQPHSEIFWWIESSLEPLLAGDPDLAGTIPFRRERWTNPLRWPEALASVREIRRRHFDVVIDLQSLARSGAVAWLANPPFSIGLNDPREGARGFYDVVVDRPSPTAHAVDWYLQVLPLLGAPVHQRFHWIPDRPEVRSAILGKWNAADHPWIVLQPGARWTNKRWPLPHFADLVRLLARSQPQLRFAILGSKADQAFGQTLSQAAEGRCLDLTGRTSLPEMVEWIRLGSVMVTNDTGPMHVAAALGKPAVAIFGPTDPRRTGPYGQPQNVFQTDLPCVPCLRDICTYAQPLECLRAISPAAVAERVRQLLSVTASAQVKPPA